MAYKTTYPYTNKVMKEFESHSDEYMMEAIKTADELYHSDWSSGPVAERAKVIARAGELFLERIDEIAEAMTYDMGKLMVRSRGETSFCADIAKYYAENAEKLLEPKPYENIVGEGWVEYHPIGVIMAVEPWNYPHYQLLRVVAPNYILGNPVIHKHASIVPQCAMIFEQIMLDAGAPKGAVTNLFIDADQVAKALADDRVQGVALTGSENAGIAVAVEAARNLKKSTMELGGNDAFIVLDDADLENTARVARDARLANAGQICSAAKRFVLHKDIADEFLALMKKEFEGMIMGDPFDPKSTLSPLSSKSAKLDLQKQLDDAIKNGATVVTGNAEAPGCFFTPTIITDITPDNPAYYQEFFGPVAQVYVVDDDDAAVKLASDSKFGLGGSIFTKDIERAKKMASKIETGMIYIGSQVHSSADLPFGGIKRSGYGRELADLGFKEFANQKLVVVFDERIDK